MLGKRKPPPPFRVTGGELKYVFNLYESTSRLSEVGSFLHFRLKRKIKNVTGRVFLAEPLVW